MISYESVLDGPYDRKILKNVKVIKTKPAAPTLLPAKLKQGNKPLLSVGVFRSAAQVVVLVMLKYGYF